MLVFTNIAVSTQGSIITQVQKEGLMGGNLVPYFNCQTSV